MSGIGRALPPGFSSVSATCAIVAVGVHAAALLFGALPKTHSIAPLTTESIEVSLVSTVESATALVAEVPVQEPQIEAIVEQPVVEPEPEPWEEVIMPPEPEPAPQHVATPEMVMPEPAAAASPAPTPKARPKPAPLKSPKPAAAQTLAGAPGSKPGALTGGGVIKSTGRPAFLKRPSPAYPQESRAAGEHGVVLLRITVDGSGRPTAVDIVRGSGYPRLDRAAKESAWRCRVANAPAGAQIDAPVHFQLRK